MGSIIIALPKIEDSKNISHILQKYGINSDFVCSSASQVLANVNQLNNGIVICGVRLPDMYYTQLAEYLPQNFEMLLIASVSVLENCPQGITTLTNPIKARDLVEKVEMMLETQAKKIKKIRQQPKTRTVDEQNYIDNVKQILMEKNNMTEQEAFRYIQKNSMDSSTNMIETAQNILTKLGL